MILISNILIIIFLFFILNYLRTLNKDKENLNEFLDEYLIKIIQNINKINNERQKSLNVILNLIDKINRNLLKFEQHNQINKNLLKFEQYKNLNNTFNENLKKLNNIILTIKKK